MNYTDECRIELDELYDHPCFGCIYFKDRQCTWKNEYPAAKAVEIEQIIDERGKNNGKD